MRHNFVLATLALTLSSSAFAADDNKVLFAPDYSQVVKAGEEEGLIWEPTVKSVQKITFDKTALRPTEKRTINREALRAMTVSETSAFGQTATAPSVVELVVDFQTYRAEIERLDPFDSSTKFFRVEGSDFLSHVSTVGDSVAGENRLPGNPGKVEHRSIRTRQGSSYLVEWDEEENNRLMARCRPVREHEPEVLSSVIARIPTKAIAPPMEPEVMGPCDAGMVLTDVVDFQLLFDRTGYDYFLSDEERVSYARNVVAAMNATIINSQGVGWVNLVNVGFFEYTSQGVLGDDLRAVMASPVVVEYRETHHADVVGLFVGPKNMNAGGVTPAFTGEAALGFMVAHVAVSADTPVHEFGHMLGGMGHQPEYWDNPTTPWAYGHMMDGWFGDTMSIILSGTCPNGCGIVPVFSNPNVSAYGKPTGVAGQRENWKLIGTYLPVVSRYKAGSQPVCMPSPLRTFGVVK